MIEFFNDLGKGLSGNQGIIFDFRIGYLLLHRRRLALQAVLDAGQFNGLWGFYFQTSTIKGGQGGLVADLCELRFTVLY